MTKESLQDSLYKGLTALAECSFPKKCNTCGRTFNNADEFVAETELIRPTTSGLKQSTDDDGAMIVELFRNCPCGSTLMDAFNDRRDLSDKGEQRRERFNELLEFLEKNHHLEKASARNELLKVMKGEPSSILANIPTPPKHTT